ncbi:MAG: hypothetical protein KAH16_02530 [Candidatus Izimaplasma sp.]|nr:hypothetical protein [Candidatus Izimaplasma bacterium]
MYHKFTQVINDVLKLETKDMIGVCQKDRVVLMTTKDVALLAEEEKTLIIDNTFNYADRLRIFNPEFVAVSGGLS